MLDTGAGAERLIAEVGPARRDRLSVVTWDLRGSAGGADEEDGSGRSGGVPVPDLADAVPAPVPASALGSTGKVGAVIVVDPYALATPDEVPALLDSASGISTAVVVITRLLAESGDEDHDYEEDITRLLLDGGAVPTQRDLSRSVAAAGLTGVADLPVGWGTHAVVTLKL